MKKISQKIAYASLFSAVALVFNIFTLPNTPIGTISFVYVPCILAGLFLGVGWGFTVGFVGDLLGCIIAPKGAISLLILISSGMIGMISGIVFRLLRKRNLCVKMIAIYFSVLIICTLGFSSLGNYVVATFLQNTYLTFWDYLLIARLPKQPFILLLNVILTYSLVLFMQRQPTFQRLMITERRNNC